MTTSSLRTQLLLLLLIFIAIPRGATAKDPETISVAEIKPGMKGYGLTVFSGTEPEKFEVEVVDIVPNFMLKQDIILIMCKHPVTDKAGVIGGMSGSPIYLDGRLAGALAYGWRFSKEALAGVTPIKNMYDITDRKNRGTPKDSPFAKMAAAKHSAFEDNIAVASTFQNQFRAGDASGLVPARMPLSLSGFSGQSRQMLDESLSPFGIVPMQGGGSGAAAEDGPDHFVEGGPIGVQLISGDLSATAIGTVTTIKDGNVLAFGHPMFNMGEGYLPVTTAKIHTVIASLSRSNKMGSPIKEIGSLVQDRTAGIMARTDLKADMIPVRFNIVDSRSGVKATYNIKVANRQWLSGRLIHAALVQFIQHSVSDVADVTAEISGTVKLKGRPAIHIEDSGVSRQGLTPLVSYFRPTAIIHSLLANPFENVTLENLEFDVTLRYGLSYATVKGMYLTTQKPAPGDNVNVHVRLMEFGGTERVVTIPVRIPAEAENQKIKLTVGGGNDIDPQMPTPENLDEAIANVSRLHPAKSLVLKMETHASSFSVRGHLLEDLPISALTTLNPVSGNDSSQKYKTELLKVVETDIIVSGTQSIQITVGRRMNK